VSGASLHHGPGRSEATSSAGRRTYRAQGDRHIARQRDLIAQFELRGHDTTMACTLLVQFEELQAIHVATHARLLRELGIVLI